MRDSHGLISCQSGLYNNSNDMVTALLLSITGMEFAKIPGMDKT